MRKVLELGGKILLVLVGLSLAAGAALAAVVLSRDPPAATPSTTHPTLGRGDCLSCHEPIAEEWRASLHHGSVTGPYWEDVRRLGYARLFEIARKRCLDCHAPANVLDLPGRSATTAGGSARVECTPNLLREPEGIVPRARADEVELGVDCVACHVSRSGIRGSGRRPTSAHETIADERFQEASRTARTLCWTCHRSVVEAWLGTRFAREGVTCLECHMPPVVAPSVAAGARQARRSHAFPGDKDEEMLRRAVNASLRVTDGQAVFRIVNDRVGHHLPTGGNFLSVRLRARDERGAPARETVAVFGREEALLLDFWPFARDGRIPAGEAREVRLALPPGHGVVEAVVRYHDWMHVRRTVAELGERF